MFGMMMFVSKMSVSAAAADAAAATAALAATPLNVASQSSIDPEELKAIQKQMGDPMKALKEGLKEGK